MHVQAISVRIDAIWRVCVPVFMCAMRVTVRMHAQTISIRIAAICGHNLRPVGRLTGAEAPHHHRRLALCLDSMVR